MDNKEQLLLKRYSEFIEILINERHWDDLDQRISDKFVGYGSTTDEKFLDFKGVAKMVKMQKEQAEGFTVTFDKKNIFKEYSPGNDYAIFIDEFDVVLELEEGQNLIPLRCSLVMTFEENDWRVKHLHGSVGVETEEDTWHMQEWQQKMDRLQALVDEQTEELRIKNQELEIESSLERVRAIAMGMKKSDDLLDVCKVLFKELITLDFTNLRNVAIHTNITDKKYVQDYDYSNFTGGQINQIAAKGNKVVTKYFKDISKSRNAFTEIKLSGKILEEWKAFRRSNNLMDDSRLESCKTLYYYGYSIGTASFAISTFNPITALQNTILKRLRNVLDLAYQRFLDISNAEAQTREAQIEAALERVRARSMAMHHTSELQEVINTVHQQFTSLEIPITGGVFIAINEENQKEVNCWGAGGTADYVERVYIPFFNKPIYTTLIKNIQKKPGLYSEEYSTREKKEFIEYLFERPPYNQTSKKRKAEVMSRKGGYARSTAVSNNTSIFMVNHHGEAFSDDDNEILQRFGKVFEQAYTRFLDLEKAEEQAKEAQIELSLERVRSKAMAMRNSKNIAEATTILFHEIEKLDIETIRCGIVIINKNKVMDAWTSSTDDSKEIIRITGQIDMTIHPLLLDVYDKWESKESFYTEFELKGDLGKAYYKALSKEANYNLPANSTVNEDHYCTSFLFEEGAIFVFTKNKIPSDIISVFERFARVFGLTYQRYRELKESEKREKEAKKQASLDRVRGEIASMRSTEDLNRITPIIWRELQNLGVPFFRCGVFIMNENQKDIDVFLSDPEGNSLGLMSLDFDTNEITKESVLAWKEEKIYKAHWDKEGFIAWTKTLSDLGKINTTKQYQGGDDAPESLHLHFVPFSQGMLYVGHLNSLKDEHLSLVKNLAKSFSIAYARYEDFIQLEKAKEHVEKALNDLKAAQKQLIQSEKMASLGELTAGIAHEIQNPLNFVNNFSEVSNELIDELDEELEKGELDEVKAILIDIKQNLQKINYHGKRADDIVKGMLEHSRASSGEKQPTDINALCDEYLRLSYHGLRAKDKSFNSSIMTNFDSSIGKINVIQQDMGRVVLNLVNNAFYATSELKKLYDTDLPKFKTRTGLNSYVPTVSITTKNEANHIKIVVKDNGLGIPKQVVDKIFQPFFTTKPTGHGTGLGLSLSYDIIKAHEGTIEVDSQEGKGTTFTISITTNR